ncbi:MAG: hypothetical protein D6696_07650 [Acidobacteria bacterium]|nr:MAG: hypothetical protein D6696_07650 [Acidobacteriota bacterium]
MARRKRQRRAKRRPPGARPPAARPPAGEAAAAPRWRRLAPLLAIVLWPLAVDGAFLAGSLVRETPISAFFYGDSMRFVEGARRRVLDLPPLNEGLPFRPPLTGWLITPWWWIFDDVGRVSVAAKLSMALLCGVTYALFYLLVRRRLPGAFLIALLLPLSFGEIVLASAVSSEVPYRLLWLLILLAGWRRPWIAGALHGLAALTRAEHLILALGLFALAMFVPARRGYALRAGLAAALVLLPHTLTTSQRLRDYNRAHRDELAAPLPAVVPVAINGPINFAMAQEAEEIFFRWTVPPPAGESVNRLEPTDPLHYDYLVHGYGRGLRLIRRQPGRFLRRAAAKVAYASGGLAYGWTWRDLPKRGEWLRAPVDVARGAGGAYLALCLGLLAAGAWSLRRQRALLAVGFGLLAYRLAIDALFFPFVRSVLIVSPFVVALQLAALHPLLKRAYRPVLATLLALLAAFHLSTAAGERRYTLTGERDASGTIIDDRPVTIRYLGRGAPHRGAP